MSTSSSLLALVAFAAAALPQSSPPEREHPDRGIESPKLRDVLPHAVPLAFVENRGQWPTSAAFVARGSDASVRVERHGLWIELVGADPSDGRVRRQVLHCAFVGARGDVTAEGRDRRPGLHHFFLGSDPTRWHADVPAYASVVLEGVWPGVDLTLRERDGCLFEYSIALEPGADPSVIRFRWEGGTSTSLDELGRSVLDCELGSLVETAPRAWQYQPDGLERPVACRFAPGSDGSRGFELGVFDANAPLWIDPGLVWSSYLGGSLDDLAFALAVAADGDAIIGGTTHAMDFPITPGAIDAGGDFFGEAFVTRMDANGGSLVYSTYLGGATFPPGFSEWVESLRVDSQGVVTVAGQTESPDFPTTPGAYDTSYNGQLPGAGYDWFVARLRPDGSGLLFSTYIGGASEDWLRAMDVDGTGSITLVGYSGYDPSSSSNFPTTAGAYQPTSPSPWWSGAICRLSADGASLDWGTFLAGSVGFGTDVTGVVVEPDGAALVCGHTDSFDFPVTPGAFDTTFAAPPPGRKGFISRLDSSGSTLLASTFVGNPGSAGGSEVYAVDVGEEGTIAVVGVASADFPIPPGAFDPNGPNGVIAIFDSSLTSLLRSTFLGSPTIANGDFRYTDVEYEECGAISLAGWTEAKNFPTTPGAFDTDNPIGNRQGIVTRLRPDLGALLYSTYLGADIPSEFLHALHLDGELQATVAGICTGPGFPTTPGAFDSTFGGSGPQAWGDAIVSRLDLLPAGASRYGDSTSACLGSIQAGALGPVTAGSSSFAVYCTGAPPLGIGFLGLATNASVPPLPILGIDLHLDPLQLALVKIASADTDGYAVVALPLPASAGGITGYFQFLWLGTPACGGTGAFFASDGLAVSIP